MDFRIPVIVIVVVVIAFAAYGLTISERTFRIGDCTSTYSAFPKTVADPVLCPVSGTCTASPEAQQRNAAVDVLLCACAGASEAGYADAGQNKNIVDLASILVDGLNAQDICDNLPTIATKQAYE